MRSLIAIIVATFLSVAMAQEPVGTHAIGVEEDTLIVLERGDYLPRPLDDRTPLIVRLGEVTAGDDGFTYRFHFIGFEPGEYRLADYLMHPDGSPAVELGDRTFEVVTILPSDHDGSLTSYLPGTVPWFGGYRIVLIALAAIWVLGWVALAYFGRRRRKENVVESAPPPPTFAQRMRPYVEAAADGKLDAKGQAELERLFLGYWRDKLEVPKSRLADELAQLRKHPDAGKLLVALERWLHRPGGASVEEVDELLAPYRGSGGKEVSA